MIIATDVPSSRSFSFWVTNPDERIHAFCEITYALVARNAVWIFNLHFFKSFSTPWYSVFT